MERPDHGWNGWFLKAFIITMMNNSQSVVSTRKLLYSIDTTEAQIQPFIFPATIPETMIADLEKSFHRSYYDKLITQPGDKIRYTWPTHTAQDGIDLQTGIYKRAYSAKDWRKVAACTISHMRLWQHCIDINEPILILEHDAYFREDMKYFSYRKIVSSGQKENSGSSMQWTGGICGINDPRGTTRKAGIFDSKVRSQLKGHPGLTMAPYVDEPGDLPLPNGLAGNSAYIIKPWAAKKLLEKTAEVGIWPNDALMCKQFFPWLQVLYPYYTVVQNTPSTTTG